MPELLLAAAALAAGYTLGRYRPGPRLLDWAEDADRRGWRAPTAWIAQPILAVALAAVWVRHPRRSLANLRTWRADQRQTPTPALNPNWAADRGADISKGLGR